jgi:capsular exopolysaccharide synthesis family protein
MAVGGTVGYAYAQRSPAVYEARATLLVGLSLRSSDPDYDALLASQAITATYANIATSRPTLERVSARLGRGDAPEELAKMLAVAVEGEAPLLIVTARAGQPDDAALLANALAQQLVADATVSARDATVQRQITTSIGTVQRQIRSTQIRVERLSQQRDRTSREAGELDELRGQLISLRDTYVKLLALAAGSGSNTISLVDVAVPPTSPVAPRPLLIGMLAAFLGTVCAGILAFGRRAFDDRLRDPGAISHATSLPALGVVSVKRGVLRRLRPRDLLPTLAAPRSTAAEAIRSVRWRVEFASRQRDARTILVASADVAEGKTVLAANLAIAFAQAGRRVVLIDGDFRRPRIDRLFRIPNRQGLSSLVRDDVAASEAAVPVATQPRLSVLPSGPLPVNPAEFLGSDRTRATIEALASASDLIVIDAPPLSIGPDALALASMVDATLLVVDLDRTRRARAQDASVLVAEAGAQLLGVVAVRLPRRAYRRYRQRGVRAKPKPAPVATRASEPSPTNPIP